MEFNLKRSDAWDRSDLLLYRYGIVLLFTRLVPAGCKMKQQQQQQLEKKQIYIVDRLANNDSRME